MKELTELAQRAVLNGDIPAKDIADKVGKKYSTLMRELNPYDEGAKLSPETLVELMRITKDITPLKVMAESLGYKVIPAGSPEPSDIDENYISI
jgi:hypothetical protein